MTMYNSLDKYCPLKVKKAGEKTHKNNNKNEQTTVYIKHTKKQDSRRKSSSRT